MAWEDVATQVVDLIEFERSEAHWKKVDGSRSRLQHLRQSARLGKRIPTKIPTEGSSHG